MRTRFVCVADTHNSPVRLPAGDVLVHAGDLTNQGSLGELQRAVAWLDAADFEAKIVVAGNHDVTLDEAHAAHSAACRELLAASSLTYLAHSAATVRLRSPAGPRTRFTVFGSPYSPRRAGWAFGYDAPGPDAPGLWDAIPADADVVVTHTPPRSHCDAGAGCEALRRALARVRPRLAACGHVHAARGAERVTWGAGAGNRLSLVDLTGRRASPDGALLPALANDGASRREMCVVNAAVTGTSYPHAGGKRLHKAIVVDVDLPLC